MLPPARRGSKRGWKNVTGVIPPDEYARLERLVERTGRRRTDLVADAIRHFLERAA